MNGYDFKEDFNFIGIKGKQLDNLFRKYEIDPLLLDLISKILVYEPNKRITPLKALNHPYFDELKEKFDMVKLQKAKLNEIYGSINKEMIVGSEFNDWRFNILLDNRDEILNKIFEQGLFASHHYYPIGLFFNLQNQSIWNGLYKGVLNLFNDFRITEEEAIRIVKIINEHGEPFNYK